VLPSGTVTFLMTDVEGSTDGWARSPAAQAEAIPRHYEILDDAVRANGGVRPVEQGEGDSIVAAFTRPSGAIAAAVQAQRALAAESWPGDQAVNVRMALHTGEAQFRDEGNYCGVAVIRCARIRDCGHGGQILVSETTAMLTADQLPDGTSLIDLGRHRPKGLGRLERIWQLGHPDLGRDFPPLRSLDDQRHNLPVQLTSFVGREAELAVLRKLLAETRILTLTGSGGCGKTRLAVEFGDSVLDSFADGVWLVDLAPIEDGDAVASIALRTFGLREEQARPAVDTLTGYLRERRAMLIVDNCEHLLPACGALCEELVRSCPGVHVLATSRAPLNVAGELPWRVPSLSVPADPSPLRIETLDTFEAVRLFVDRARRARPNFEVTNESAPAVAEICARLDGIPLAIELAAARTRVLTTQQICDGLADRFRLLVGGARSATPRQQTLQASVDWSYELLQDDERTLLRRLAVFAGAATLDTVEAVCEGDGLERLAVLDLLTGLVDKSLVMVDDDGPVAHYRLLETIRQYAAAQLAESGDQDRVRSRHRDVHLVLAERIEPLLFGAEQERATTELLDVHPNLLAAFDWSRDRGDAEEMLRFVAALFYYFIVRGMVTQGRRWSLAALAGGSEAAGLRARALVADGHLSFFASDAAAAYESAAAAVELAENAGDRRTRLRAAGLLAEVLAFADPATGVPRLADNLAAAAEDADLWWLSEGRCNLGAAQFVAGDAAGARRSSAEALAVTELSGDVFERRQALCFTGWLAATDGDLVRSLDVVVPLVDDARATHDTSTLPLALASLALVHTFAGEFAAARAAADESVVVSEEAGSPWTPCGYAARAGLALYEGDLETLADADEGFRRAGIAMGFQPDNLTPWLAWAHASGGDAAAARALLDGMTTTSGAFLTAGHLHATAVVERADGKVGRAEDAAHGALAAARADGLRVSEVDCVDLLAGLAADLDSPEEAARLLGAGEARRRAAGYVRPAVAERAHELAVAAVVDAVGADGYEALAAEGAAMTWTEALDYATRGRGQRKRPSSGWESLTPAEQSVVRLVAEGLTNQQVAQRLFVSRRTVGTHLTHIFAKLGLSNRSELTAAAVRRGG
jgi:predicted ATPase/DNA-binding CsgD family transcriptional regulator